MKYIITCVFMLFFGYAFSQSNETVGTTDFEIRDDLDNEYSLIRTDLDGNIMWNSPINKYNNPFDMSQGTYIVCGFTEVVDGRIIDNPCDYDYWIVKIISNITVTVYPNPATKQVNVTLNSYTDELDFYLFDVNLKLIQSYKLTNFITPISLPELSNGLYIYNVISNHKPIKIGKLCVTQNTY